MSYIEAIEDERCRQFASACSDENTLRDLQDALDTESMLIVAVGVTDCANDKRQIMPMLETLAGQGAGYRSVEKDEPIMALQTICPS